MATAGAKQIAEETDYAALASQVMAAAALCRAAVEEESLFELRLPGGSAVSYAILPGQREELLSGRAGTMELPEDDDAIAGFIQVYARARLCYGYPVMHYADGAARPLFVSPVRLNGRTLELDTSAPARLNCGLLLEMGVPAARAGVLAREITDPKLDLAAKIGRIADELQIDATRFDIDNLQDVPEGGFSGRMQWSNRPIVAALTMPPSRALVVKELSALTEADRAERAGDTALLGLAEPLPQLTSDGDLPALKEPMVWDIHRLGPSQTQVVRAAMTQRLTGVSAPPGTG